MSYELKKSDNLAGSDDLKPVAETLSQVLADTFTLYLKTLNYHWNVEGARFVGIHNLTDEQYHNMFEAIDTLAERIRALGYYSPGSYEEFSKMTTIHEASTGTVSAGDMLQNLENDHMTLVAKLKESIPVVEKHDDSTTADLLSERRDFHEQAAWMLRSLGK